MTTTIIPSPILVYPPTGSSKLPIIELNRADVLEDRKRIRTRLNPEERTAQNCSFGQFQDDLSFTAWEFFHAAKKTELMTTFTTSQIDRRALTFADEHSDRFIWNTGNLRRVDRNIFCLEDFTEAGLAGRFGEAVAYLTMVKWGYVYWDRVAVVWERAVASPGMTHPEQLKEAHEIAQTLGVDRPDLEPDFAFEKTNGDIALMEAKGSFVHPINDNPSTKGDLRHALKQLGAWSGRISPTPKNSFAIGTYFRDKSDSTGDPSLIAFVDQPESDGNSQAASKSPPDDWIRRGNYGAWLAEMGFRTSGRALAERRATETTPTELGVINLGGHDYAFTIQGWRIDQSRLGMLPWYPFDVSMMPLRHQIHFLRRMGITGVYVAGLDVAVLRAVSASLGNANAKALMDLQPLTVEFGRSQPLDGFYGSVMPDGSMIGVISTRPLESDPRVEAFKL